MAITTLLKKTFGLRLPADIAKEFTQSIQKHFQEHPLTPLDLNTLFCNEYIENFSPFELAAIDFEKQFVNTPHERIRCQLNIKYQSHSKEIEGFGSGALSACINAFATHYGIELEVKDYLQHSLIQTPQMLAASYVLLTDNQKQNWWGFGVDSDCTLSVIRALLSAINRSQKNKPFSSYLLTELKKKVSSLVPEEVDA